MKKVLKISLILIVMIFIMGNVYAALSYNVNLKTNKTQINKNEEFTVDVNISNIKSDRGIISLGGTLEYDKNSLELVKMDGQNGWETPSVGASYNETNGKIAITRSGPGKSNETVFKITFKVKNGSKQNVTIGLKDITVADGKELAKIDNKYTNVTIKKETTNPITKPEDNTNTNTNIITDTNTITDTKQDSDRNLLNTEGNSSTSNIEKKDDSIKSGKLPQTGETSVILISCIGLIILGAIIYYIKIKKINKKVKRRH